MSNQELSQKVQKVLEEKKPIMLSSLATQFGVTEKEIAEVLPYEMCSVTSGSNFSKVWDNLTTWEKATFIVQHAGHVIEIKCTIPQGKEGHGYYNLMGENPLGGHIKADAIAHIAFLSIPFMGLESHSVQFFAEDGSVAFAIYVGREKKVLIPSAREAFFKIKEELK